MSRYVTKGYLGGLAAKLAFGVKNIFGIFILNKKFSNKSKKNRNSLQFMGLRDKNGTLIYVNDILKDDNNNLLTPVCEVLNGEHILFFKPIQHLHKNFAIGCKSTYSETLEIIGNMKESPELIKSCLQDKRIPLR